MTGFCQCPVLLKGVARLSFVSFLYTAMDGTTEIRTVSSIGIGSGYSSRGFDLISAIMRISSSSCTEYGYIA